MAATPTAIDLVSLLENICWAPYVDAPGSEDGRRRWNCDGNNPEGRRSVGRHRLRLSSEVWLRLKPVVLAALIPRSVPGDRCTSEVQQPHSWFSARLVTWTPGSGSCS